MKISISMPPPLKRAADKRAKQQKRSVSAHIQFLLEGDLVGSGIEIEPTNSKGASR